MKILVKFPSRERPDRFLRTLREYIRLADDPSRIIWLFSFDGDDEGMWGMREKIAAMGIDAYLFYRKSESKVHAINRDIEEVKEPWDILAVVSDDMWPVMRGWDVRVRETMQAHHPDGDALLWFFDGKQKDICTLPIMGRKFYDRTGFVYDPRFRSVFCDDLQTAMARHLGRLICVAEPLAHHRHPANFSDVKPDALYRRNETPQNWAHDHALFLDLIRQYK